MIVDHLYDKFNLEVKLKNNWIKKICWHDDAKFNTRKGIIKQEPTALIKHKQFLKLTTNIVVGIIKPAWFNFLRRCSPFQKLRRNNPERAETKDITKLSSVKLGIFSFVIRINLCSIWYISENQFKYKQIWPFYNLRNYNQLLAWKTWSQRLTTTMTLLKMIVNHLLWNLLDS